MSAPPGSLDAIEVARTLRQFALDTIAALPDHVDCGNAALSVYDPEFGVVCGGCAQMTFVHHPELTAVTSPDQKVGAVERFARAEGTDKLVVSTGDIASAVSPVDPIISALDVIDPTEVYDSAMVEAHILDAVARLQRGSQFQRVCLEEYGEAKLTYALKYARALDEAARGGGAADIRKARAMLMCEQEYRNEQICRMKCEAVETTMHSLRSMLSGYQSVGSSIRAAYQGTGRQQL